MIEAIEAESCGDEIIDGLLDHMGSEDLAEEFDRFATFAAVPPDLLEVDEEDIPEEGAGYWVIAQKMEMPINGKETLGIYVAIWPHALAPEADFLPAHLSRARHARFLEIDLESELVCEMHALPTLH